MAATTAIAIAILAGGRSNERSSHPAHYPMYVFLSLSRNHRPIAFLSLLTYSWPHPIPLHTLHCVGPSTDALTSFCSLCAVARQLDSSERGCITVCAEKYMAHMARVGQRFAEETMPQQQQPPQQQMQQPAGQQ